MIVIYCQHRDALTSAERRMVAGMRDLPGLLLVNALVTTGRRTREIDGIWIHPDGVAAVEAKGTGLAGELVAATNGPWRIGGSVADFASGPNPLMQARTAAQTLRTSLTEDEVHAGFIPAVVAVAGNGVTLASTLVGDMAVCLVDELTQLPHLLAGTGARVDNSPHSPTARVGVEDARAILRSLDLAPGDIPTTDELTGEGFCDQDRFLTPERVTPALLARPRGAPARSASSGRGGRPRFRGESRGRAPAAGSDTVGAATGPKPAQHASSRDRRRARRFADLEAQAVQDWRCQHRRRLSGSVAAVAVLAYYLPHLPLYCVFNGLIAGVLAGAYQLAVRRRMSGPRDTGPAAVGAWLVTLVPILGMGASISWIAALPTLNPLEWPFVMMLAILVAAGLGCAIVNGRSAFVHPPAMVIERYDDKGRPTGAFMLAKASPLHFPSRDWRPAESSETDEEVDLPDGAHAR